MDDFIYFPCESIYGNIEIKSSLNKQSFDEAVKNIASLKKLSRKGVDGYYVNPMKPLNIGFNFLMSAYPDVDLLVDSYVNKT